jgi:hypothetical protein
LSYSFAHGHFNFALALGLFILLQRVQLGNQSESGSESEAGSGGETTTGLYSSILAEAMLVTTLSSYCSQRQESSKNNEEILASDHAGLLGRIITY